MQNKKTRITKTSIEKRQNILFTSREKIQHLTFFAFVFFKKFLTCLASSGSFEVKDSSS
jgi:hypothetical protein